MSELLPGVLGLWYIATNLSAFFLCLYDKRMAQLHRFRVPERRLLLLSVFGGCLGLGIGMILFRHKTRKPLFSMTTPLFIILHALILTLLFYASPR